MLIPHFEKSFHPNREWMMKKDGSWHYFDVSTLGNFDEVFLLLERFLFFVVRHAEDPQARLLGFMTFGEHHEPFRQQQQNM